jgi:hypothetical protein
MSFENRGKSTAIPAIRRFIIFPNQREQFARVLRIDGTVSSNVFRRCTINSYFDVAATFGLRFVNLTIVPSHDALIRVHDEAGKVIETYEQAGESSTYTRLGSTLTISGERDAPRWL